jgi:hypothetical protein
MESQPFRDVTVSNSRKPISEIIQIWPQSLDFDVRGPLEHLGGSNNPGPQAIRISAVATGP